MAERRENKTDGQLRPGILTSEPEFLGKVSTIRAEYPVFYEKLVTNPRLMEEVTNQFQTQTIEDDKQWFSERITSSKLEALIGYLRKTQTISTTNIEPFIWLSQDSLALGLSYEQTQKLRISLANGNHQEVIGMVEDTKDKTEKELIERVATRYVDLRLKGLEQQNGTVVLARMIEIVEPSIRSEVAQVAANHIPRWELEVFTANEVLGVLQWAPHGENKRLIESLLDRLNDLELRNDTFRAIMNYWTTIEVSEATTDVQEWLNNILDHEEQSEEENQDFAYWLIVLTKDYQDDNNLIEQMFAHSLTTYMIDRIVGKYPSIPTMDLSTEEGLQYKEALFIIARYSETGRPTDLWVSVTNLLISNSLIHFNLGSNLLRDRTNYIPLSNVDELINSTALGISKVADSVSDGYEIWLNKKLNLLRHLIDRKENALDEKERTNLRNCLIILGSIDHYGSQVQEFSVTFINDFKNQNAIAVLEALLELFDQVRIDTSKASPYLTILLKYKDRLDDVMREDIANSVDKLAISNSANEINAANHFLLDILTHNSFNESIEDLSHKWLGLIQSQPAPILKARVNLELTLQNARLISADEIALKLLELMPFGGNQNQLTVVIETLEKIRDEITDTTGLKTFQTLMVHTPHYGSLLPRFFGLMTQWTHIANRDEQEKYVTSFLGQFNNDPIEFTAKLPLLWKSMNTNQMRQQLIMMYKLSSGTYYELMRDECSQLAFDYIDSIEKVNLVENVWNELTSTGNSAEQFMEVAKEKLSLEEINELRENSIKIVRELGSASPAKDYLRLLSSTFRSDVREVMPVVSLFCTLFGQGENEVMLATEYVLPCLLPMNLRSNHKHRLAESMAEAASRFNEDIEKDVQEKAKELGIFGWRWGAWAYKKHWEKWDGS